MRVLQSQNRASNPNSWEAIMDFSIAASEKEDEEDSDEAELDDQ